MLLAAVGYSGNTTYQEAGKSKPATGIKATAVAARAGSSREYCIVALGQADVQVDIDVNGAPKANLAGCGIMSNEGMNCVGAADGFAAYADSPTGDPGACGRDPSDARGVPLGHRMPAPKVVDPYKHYASNIPTEDCTETTVDQISVAPTQSVITYCGGVKLMQNINITTPTTIIVRDGNLDLNGKNLTGSALTIVFAGRTNYQHKIVGNGDLKVTAPTSGDWKGVAIYQHPDLVGNPTENVDFAVAGGNNALEITGLMYLPNTSLTISGAVNKDVSPMPCMILMVGALRINGGGLYTNRDRCDSTMNLPSVHRGRLVS
jgi:hypothetical protein